MLTTKTPLSHLVDTMVVGARRLTKPMHQKLYVDPIIMDFPERSARRLNVLGNLIKP